MQGEKRDCKGCGSEGSRWQENEITESEGGREANRYLGDAVRAQPLRRDLGIINKGKSEKRMQRERKG